MNHEEVIETLAEIGEHHAVGELDAAIRKTRGLQSELMQERCGGGQ